jgi:hypothetical protein
MLSQMPIKQPQRPRNEFPSRYEVLAIERLLINLPVGAPRRLLHIQRLQCRRAASVEKRRGNGTVRDSARFGNVVQAVDQKHIAALEQIFNDIGYIGKDARVRACGMCRHQVGYYAMGAQEPPRERRALIPPYRNVSTGRDG